MIDISKLNEKANKLHADAEKIATNAVNEGRVMNGEEKESFSKMTKEALELRSQIREMNELNASEAGFKQIDNPLSIGRESKEVKIANPKEVELSAWRSYLTDGYESLNSNEKAYLRSLSLSGTSGYTAPELVTNEFINILRNVSDIRKAPVRVFNTVNGNTMPFPVLDYTAENNTTITAETSDVGLADDPSVSRKTLGSFMVTSGILKVSKQFLRDSAMPVEQYINEALAESIAIKSNALYTTGAGTTEPVGIVTGVHAVAGRRVTLANGSGYTTEIAAGGSDAAKAKDLLANLNSVKYKVSSRYRTAGQCGWMFNDNTLKYLSNFVDGQGRQLLQPAMGATIANGVGLTLLGDPIYINNDMADIGVSAKPIVYGNFSKFFIRDVGTVSVDRLVERYAEYLMIGYNGYFATDSIVADTNAFSVLVNAAS